MNKPLVIYHKACMDGLGAAWAAWKFFGDNAEYVSAQYGDEPPNELYNRDIYILDFSYKRDVTKKIAAEANNLVLIDHHATAIADLAEIDVDCMNVSAKFDTAKSGAVLAWEYWHPGTPAPVLLQLVQDRDLWHFIYAHTKTTHAYLKTQPYTINSFDKSVGMVDDNEKYTKVVEPIGEAILQLQQEISRSCISDPRKMNFNGNVIPVFNCPGHFISDSCDMFLKENPDEPIVAAYFDMALKRVFSLRAREGVDASHIAKHFGGGGHPRACGFSLPRSHPLARE